MKGFQIPTLDEITAFAVAFSPRAEVWVKRRDSGQHLWHVCLTEFNGLWRTGATQVHVSIEGETLEEAIMRAVAKAEAKGLLPRKE